MEDTSISIIIPADQSEVPLTQCLQSIIDFGSGVKEIMLVLGGIPYQSGQFGILHHFTHQTAGEQVNAFWGACGAIRKGVFEPEGGCHGAYEQASTEDIELGYRLTDRGYRIRLNKSLQVKHLKRWTLKAVVRTDIFQRARLWTPHLYQPKKLASKNLNLSNEERLITFLFLLGLFNLTLRFFWSGAAMLVLASLLGLIIFKRKIYRFYTLQFGLLQFSVIMLLHWLYLVCATTDFVLDTIDYIHQTWHFKSEKKARIKNQYEIKL